MAVPYTFGSATSAIPLTQLDSNFATAITLGNTAIQLGNTVTTLNNMTFANATISSVASTFPNSYLANSTATLGNTTITLGGTTTSVGNLTLTGSVFNGTVGATTPSTGAFTTVTASTSVTSPIHNAGSATALQLQSNGITGIYMDTSQNVGIGTSSPAAFGGRNLQINDPSNGYAGLLVSSGAYTFEALMSQTNGSTSLGMRSNHNLNLVTNDTTRVTIDTSGNLLVGTTDNALTTGNGVKVLPSLSGAGVPGFMINTTGSTSSNSSLFVYSTGASAYRFYVRNDGAIFATNTTVQSISDQRLKENVRDIDYGLDKILSLQPRRFDWKDGKGLNKKNDIGFVAQEFEQVVPEFVDQSLDLADDGTPFKTVGATGLIPVLVKAIQEQQAIITDMQAKLKAASVAGF